MKTIILSFDYELFFGERSGTVVKSIIEPTNMLMDVMEQNGMRGNFFVDYLMFRELENLTDSRAQADLTMLKEQIRDMVRRGHRIELHLHPHWIDAKYNGDGTWNFNNFAHYSLSSLDKETIVEMFTKGVAYLTALAREVQLDYKIVAFRAGGWAVQPFSILREAFEACDIKLDSSVAYKTFCRQENSEYDFMRAPSKDMYCFSNDVCLESVSGTFWEVPIYTIQRNIFDKVVDKLFRILTPFFKQYSDGNHLRKEDNLNNNQLSKKKTNRSMFCVSFLNTISFILHLFLIKNRRYVCLIDHPKDINPIALFNIRILRYFSKSTLYKDIL